MNNQQKLIQLIKSQSGQANILTIPRVYIALLDGDLVAALLLGQIVYWSDKSGRNDGWFYKSYRDWSDEIGLTQFQVKRAATRLSDLGIIQTGIRRANKAPTVHYRLNVDTLTSLIINKLDNQETSQSDYEETSLSDYEETSQSLTETTLTETTTETTLTIPPPKAKNEVQNSSKKSRDPLLDHPAVIAYRRVTHLTANLVQRKVISEKVKDIPAWEEAVRHWLGHGWSSSNLTGMVESYEKGGRSACSLCNRPANGHKPAARASPLKVPAGMDSETAEQIEYIQRNPRGSLRIEILEKLHRKGLMKETTK